MLLLTLLFLGSATGYTALFLESGPAFHLFAGTTCNKIVVNPSTSIVVTALGAFDGGTGGPGGPGGTGFAGTKPVAIFTDVSGVAGALVLSTVVPAGTAAPLM